MADRYTHFWRGKGIVDDAASIGEMADLLEAEALRLRAMAAEGVYLLDAVTDDYAELATHEPAVAKKHTMLPG